MSAGALDPATIKACCAEGYSSDVLALLLGDCYHPGGLGLTRRLLDALALVGGEDVLDVACGTGTTSLIGAVEYHAQVLGVDLSPGNVAAAVGAAATHAVSERARFRVGDAEALPVPDACCDVVVCECALCTFPDKATAAREMARVLRPGGRVGITDVTADPARLPAQLTGLAARVACVADARTEAGHQQILSEAGLRVGAVERHNPALARLVEQIGARLELLRMTAPDRLAELGLRAVTWQPVLDAARAAVADDALGYVLITAEKPCLES
jgi:ubiquinone/menaquinone biosynthesis C-methylase UbiE